MELASFNQWKVKVNANRVLLEPQVGQATTRACRAHPDRTLRLMGLRVFFAAKGLTNLITDRHLVSCVSLGFTGIGRAKRAALNVQLARTRAVSAR